MKYQLRRMILVNAGTNKNAPSGRITEVDPRGGAAVMGANAVGKTFTLRLIPLFFGHPIKELLALDSGQEGTSFICPSPTSAICFEYQRGSDRPEDLRLVVMRARSDGTDVPEYRIFPCGFDKNLFINDNRYLTDDGTDAKARAAGIVPTSKLSTSEYRSVILRGGFPAQNTKKLQGYAYAHSFGPRPLPNLDKLVATMLKKGIKFDDLVAVAVGLIQDDLGQEKNRGSLKMRQQRGELERWMKNLEAATRAVAMEPRIHALRGNLSDFFVTEREWRERRHDVESLIGCRAAEREQLEAKIVEDDRLRAITASAERLAISESETQAQEAGRLSGTAKSNYDEAAAELAYFTERRAEHWTQEMARIEPLQNERRAINGQLIAAEAVAADAAREIANAVANVESSANESRLIIEAKMAPLRAQYDLDIESIGKSEVAALDELELELTAKKDGLDQDKSPLDQRVGSLQALIANPAVPDELTAPCKDLTAKLLALSSDSERLTSSISGAQRGVQKAQRAFDDAERRLANLKRQVAKAQVELDLARARSQPDPRTLLGALEAHAGDDWKRDLARVVNPELLARTDLEPQFLPESLGESLYGWSLKTGSIDLPEWADDEARRKLVKVLEEALEAAEQAEKSQADALPGLSAAYERESGFLATVESDHSVLISRRKSLRSALDDAEAAVESFKKQGVAEATSALAAVKAKTAEIQAQLGALKDERDRRVGAIRLDSEQQRTAGGARRDSGLESLGLAMGAVDAQRQEQLEQLQVQLKQQLSSHGVDPEALEVLRKRIKDVDGQVRLLTEQQAMVEAYHAWLRGGGHGRVGALLQEAQTRARLAQEKALALEGLREAARGAQAAHDEKMRSARSRSSELETEINKLTPLIELFGDYAAQKHDRVSLSAKAEDVRLQVKGQLRSMKAEEDLIRSQFRSCLNELTMSESTVKQLIEGSLESVGHQEMLRASTMCTAYRRLGEQVISELSNSLATILNQVAQFRRRIATFESEVGRFNTKLQTALGEIKRFDRLEQLRLEIVADFSELDFYGKLKRMDDVMRRHQNDFSMSGPAQLPPQETVEALRDFMGVLGNDGLLEVDLSRHIRVHGSVVENGTLRTFTRAKDLEHVSSNGLTTLILITLLVGLVQVVRRGEPVHVPWVTDEVSTFDVNNFKALLELLDDNLIDVITASPSLDKSQLAQFSQRYIFLDRGEICHYKSLELAA